MCDCVWLCVCESVCVCMCASVTVCTCVWLCVCVKWDWTRQVTQPIYLLDLNLVQWNALCPRHNATSQCCQCIIVVVSQTGLTQHSEGSEFMRLLKRELSCTVLMWVPVRGMISHQTFVLGVVQHQTVTLTQSRSSNWSKWIEQSCFYSVPK